MIDALYKSIADIRRSLNALLDDLEQLVAKEAEDAYEERFADGYSTGRNDGFQEGFEVGRGSKELG